VPVLEEMSRDELIVVVRRQAGQISERMEANEVLSGKLARLGHLMSRNSGNSSSSPSRVDDLGKFAPPEKKERKARLLLEVPATAPRTCRASSTTSRCPPTANQAERDPRPSKIQQKISGRLTSMDRTQNRYTILGYLSTAANHDLDKITTLRDALTGQPWMPVPPAPT
jgi:hypothetical protein